jgi:hypothetical protein
VTLRQSATEKFYSHHTEPTFKYFADRRKIEFPLLADLDSQIIRAYRGLNPEAAGIQKGMALPGYFFIDTKGVNREKSLDAKYRERSFGKDVIVEFFPELAVEVIGNVEAPHLRLAVQQSVLFQAAALRWALM